MIVDFGVKSLVTELQGASALSSDGKGSQFGFLHLTSAFAAARTAIRQVSPGTHVQLRHNPSQRHRRLTSVPWQSENLRSLSASVQGQLRWRRQIDPEVGGSKHQLKLLSALQNRHRRRVILGVAEAEMKFRAAAALEKFLPVVVENDKRLARFLAPHFQVLPAELFADARAERLGDRLLGREAGGEKRRREPV